MNSHHGYTDKGIEPPVLSYILQRPIRSVQYCEYVLYRMLSYRTQELPLGFASPVLGVMREGLNHLCFPTYYRGPFVASNIANIYCTECIIGIIDNAGTPSRLRFARTRRDEGDVRGRLATTEALSYILQRPICSVSKYCESTMHTVYHAKITVSTKNFPRSQVNLRHDSSRARRAVGRACSASAARRALARSGRFVPAVYICFGKYYETPFLHTIEAHS